VEKISINEAAAILGVHFNTVRKYIAKKILTAYQMLPGGKITLDKAQVEKLNKAVVS
jgi:excisionase family DNA binding protein